MRRLLACLLLAGFAFSASAASVEFVRVWPQWRNADAFDRISEYFGGNENDGRETVVRTQPGDRAGLYFLVRVKSDASVSDAKFILETIRPDNPDAKTYTFPVSSVPANGRVFELGLTGADWPGGKVAHPVAWKLSLVDASGRVLAIKQSFLWSLPAK